MQSPNISTLLRSIKQELPVEFSTEEALVVLSRDYQAPVKFLKSLVDKGLLIRLKRGVYVLPESYDPTVAAGAIASPSYVSFETALGFYGLLPERVHSVFSVIDGRPRVRHVLGTRFEYRAQRRDLFALGMSSISLQGRNVLFASPEKALLDALAAKALKTKNISSAEIWSFVTEGMRIDDEDILRMRRRKLEEMAPLYRNKAPQFLVAEIAKRRAKR